MNIIKIAIIDTCVLLDALMINFLKTETNINRIEKWENIIYNNNVKYKRNYPKFLDNIKSFVTTSQVIGELQGLANSRLELEKVRKSEFWKSSSDFLRQKNLDEQLIEMLSVTENADYSKNVFDIGYVDIGLIELAKSKSMKIVTNDEKTLCWVAESNLVNTFIPKQMLNF